MNAINNTLNLVVIAIVTFVILRIAPDPFNSLPAELQKSQFVFCGIVIALIASFTAREFFNATSSKV